MTDETSSLPPQPSKPATGHGAPPAPEPPLATGSLVAVVVSRGPATTPQGTPLATPNLIGTPQGDALAKLQAAGLSADVQDDYSRVVAQGSVIAQYPAPGQSAVAGSAAVLIVSKGKPTAEPRMVGLPDVVGLSEGDAVSRLKDTGLSPHVVREYSRTVPEGVVIAQLPNAVSLSQVASKRLPPWAWAAIAAAVVVLLAGGVWFMNNNQPAPPSVAKVTIEATVTANSTSTAEATSPAAPTVNTAAVPNVVGASQADAVATLKNAGFVPLVSKGPTSQSSAGNVTAQLPAGGKELEKGSQVAIQVAQAPAPAPPTSVRAPNVVGMTQANAQGTLTDAGLAPAFVTIASSAPKGSAIAQEPGAGTSVALGSAVIVEISTGAAPPATTIAVPKVVGMQESAAKSALSNANLATQVVEEFSDKIAKGTVAYQAPLAGVKVAPGTAIAIVVSLGAKPTNPTEVTVPDLKGKTAEEATQLLADLQLLTQEVMIPDATSPYGEVLGQLPAAGAHVLEGTTVVIDVSAGLAVTPH